MFLIQFSSSELLLYVNKVFPCTSGRAASGRPELVSVVVIRTTSLVSWRLDETVAARAIQVRDFLSAAKPDRLRITRTAGKTAGTI